MIILKKGEIQRQFIYVWYNAGKTSQVTYVTIVPWEWERDATSSRGRYGNASSVTGYLKHD